MSWAYYRFGGWFGETAEPQREREAVFAMSKQIKNLTLKKLMSRGEMGFRSEFHRIGKIEITQHYKGKIN